MFDEKLQKEQINRLARLLLEILNPENPEHQKMVDSGYILFSQGRVSRAKPFGNKIIAVVQDVTPCQVNLNLKDPALSKCLCPGEGICRHMLALFFQQYSSYFNERDWLQHFTSGETPAPSTATALSENTKDGIPYANWVELVDTLFEKELKNGEELYPFMVNKRIKAILEQMETMEPTGRFQAVYFQLTTHLHLLNDLLGMFLASPFSVKEYEDTCRLTMTAIFYNLEVAIGELSRLDNEPDSSFITAVRNALRDLLFHDGPFKKEVQTVYWQLWSNVLKDDKGLLEEELKHAEAMAQRSESDSLWAIAHADLLFLQQKTKDAVAVLQQARWNGFERLVVWFSYLANHESWQSFCELIPFFFKTWRSYSRDIHVMTAKRFFQSLEPLFTAYFEETEAHDLYEEFLLLMLPHSMRKLINFYFKQRKYRRLVDFLRLNNQKVTILSPEQLKTIQEEDPESLLPLLHQEVDAAIAERKRQSYQEAVFYLQHIKNIYEQLQKMDVWHLYFDKLLRTHQRLRAFKEECRKGQLIDG